MDAKELAALITGREYPFRLSKEEAGGIEREYFRGTGQDQIAMVCGIEPDNGDKDSNARRIVACVNVCTGIPTEDLERWPKELGGGMRALWDAERQRDELREALKKIDEFGHAMGIGECKRIAWAAIEQLKASNAGGQREP